MAGRTKKEAAPDTKKEIKKGQATGTPPKPKDELKACTQLYEVVQTRGVKGATLSSIDECINYVAEYMNFCEKNPYIQYEILKGGAAAGEKVPVEKKRAPSVGGFCLFSLGFFLFQLFVYTCRGFGRCVRRLGCSVGRGALCWSGLTGDTTRLLQDAFFRDVAGGRTVTEHLAAALVDPLPLRHGRCAHQSGTRADDQSQECFFKLHETSLSAQPAKS